MDYGFSIFFKKLNILEMKNLLKEFAGYIRLHVHNELNISKMTPTEVRDFLIGKLILIPEDQFHPETENLFIKAVKSFFPTNGTYARQILLSKLKGKDIDNKFKPISQFIGGVTPTDEDRLNAVAVFFDAPIKSFEKFLQKKQNIEEPKEKNVINEEKTDEKPQSIEENKGKTSKSVIENREEKKEIEQKLIKGKKGIVKNNKINKRTFAFSTAVFIFILITGFYVYPILNAQGKISETADTLEYARKKLADKFEVEEIDFNKMLVSVNQIADSKENNVKTPLPNTLTFETFRIYNSECITSNAPWTFTVDPLGEDISSRKYGFPYCNDIVLPANTLNRIPIPNKAMKIRFKISNTSTNTVRITDFSLKIDSVISANSKKYKYNVYQERGTQDETIRITLSPDTRTYPFYTQTLEIKSGAEAYFIIEVAFPETSNDCTNSIYKFHFETAFENNTLLLSDKNYFLAWKNI